MQVHVGCTGAPTWSDVTQRAASEDGFLHNRPHPIMPGLLQRHKIAASTCSTTFPRVLRMLVAIATQHTTGRACGQAYNASGRMQDKSTPDTVRQREIGHYRHFSNPSLSHMTMPALKEELGFLSTCCQIRLHSSDDFVAAEPAPPALHIPIRRLGQRSQKRGSLISHAAWNLARNTASHL